MLQASLRRLFILALTCSATLGAMTFVKEPRRANWYEVLYRVK